LFCCFSEGITITEGIRAEEKTEGSRKDRRLVTKLRVIERIEGRREDRGS
jgi:hypothetical protein